MIMKNMKTINQPLMRILGSILLSIFTVCAFTSCGYIEKKDRQIAESQEALATQKHVAAKEAGKLKQLIESLQNDMTQEREKNKLLQDRLNGELQNTRDHLERAAQKLQKLQQESQNSSGISMNTATSIASAAARKLSVKNMTR
jgi:DNA anti-recombination protein RmuC